MAIRILRHLDQKKFPNHFPKEFETFFSLQKEERELLVDESQGQKTWSYDINISTNSQLQFTLDTPFEGALKLSYEHGNKVVEACVSSPKADAHYLFGNIAKSTFSQPPFYKPPVLALSTADCLALAFTFSHENFFMGALVHAGWRGFTAGIIQNTLQAFLSHTRELSLSQEDILKNVQVWICPAIFGVSYECGEDVKDALIEHAKKLSILHTNFAQVKDIFETCSNVEHHGTNKIFPDLQLLACCELFASGITLSKIAVIRENTFGHPFFYSYRASTKQGHALKQRNVTHLVFPDGFVASS
ncbi:MAG: laccase domain-containing protein [Silvanigrellaceae bacterium]|nr:laccase domain-containing protein [Silvanigrellaceae bacterium]